MSWRGGSLGFKEEVSKLDLQDKIKKNRIGGFVYKNSLISFLALARAMEKLEYPTLNHWKALFDTLSISSEIAYSSISLLDEEVEEEFKEKEERFNRMIGKGDRLYSKEELKELEKRRGDIKL